MYDSTYQIAHRETGYVVAIQRPAEEGDPSRWYRRALQGRIAVPERSLSVDVRNPEERADWRNSR